MTEKCGQTVERQFRVRESIIALVVLTGGILAPFAGVLRRLLLLKIEEFSMTYALAPIAVLACVWLWWSSCRRKIVVSGSGITVLTRLGKTVHPVSERLSVSVLGLSTFHKLTLVGSGRKGVLRIASTAGRTEMDVESIPQFDDFVEAITQLTGKSVSYKEERTL